MPLLPTIQRGPYNGTPQRAERQQAPGFDPNAFMQMMQMMMQGTQQNIQAARAPVGQISQSSQNRPRYDIMADQNYKPGINPQYGQIGEDKLVQSNAAQPSVGQGFQGMLPPGMEWMGEQPMRTLPGMPQQQPQQPQSQGFPGGINPLTNMPPNTLPGDPGYRPDAMSPQMGQQPQQPAMPQPQQTQRDPQIQNAVDLGMLVRGYQQNNPQLQDPIGNFGVSPVTDPGDQSFSPVMPNYYPGQGQTQQPQQQAQPAVPQAPPAELNTVDGFNQPIDAQSPGGLQSLINLSTVPSAVSGQAVNWLRGGEQVVSHAQGAFKSAQNMTNAMSGIANMGRNVLTPTVDALGTFGTKAAPIAENVALSAARAATNPAVQSAMSAEALAGTKAAGALQHLKGMERIAGVLGGTGKAATALQGVGKVAAPVQAALMVLEAGRLIGDKDFREQSQRNYQSLGDKGAMAGLGQGVAAPISTIANSGVGLAQLFNSANDASYSEQALRKAQPRSNAMKAQQDKLKQQGLKGPELQKAMANFRKANSKKRY